MIVIAFPVENEYLTILAAIIVYRMFPLRPIPKKERKMTTSEESQKNLTSSLTRNSLK